MKFLAFWFDPISPYACLAFERLPQVLAGISHAVEYRPVLFAGLLQHYGQLGPAEIAPKRAWTYRQIAWQAERVLEQAEALERQIADQEGLAGPIRIGVADTFAMTCGSRLMREIETRYPQARAELRADFSVRLDASLRAGELDIAVLTWPTPDPLVHIEPLIDMPLEWVTSPQRLGDLAPRGRRRAIGPADIAHLPILTNPSPSNLYVSITDWFASAGRQPGRLITCNSLGIMARLACDGTGLSLLPVGILREEIVAGRLVILPSRPSIAAHQASVAYRRDMPGSSLAIEARTRAMKASSALPRSPVSQ